MTLGVVHILVLLAVVTLGVSAWLYRLGRRTGWQSGTTLHGIGTICAAALLAFGAVVTADKLAVSAEEVEAEALRKDYDYLFGSHYDRRWKLFLGAPVVYKGLTSSECEALKATPDSSHVPPIIDGSIRTPSVSYDRLIECTGQYTGVGEATGGFLLAEVFERMDVQLTLDWDLPERMPTDPCIIAGSMNVTYLHPELLGLRLYAEDGWIKRVGANSDRIDHGFDIRYGDDLAVKRDYGILSKIRNEAAGNDIIICEGVHSYGTEACVRALATRPRWLKGEIDQRLGTRSLDRNDVFQAVLEVRVVGGEIVNVDVVHVETW